MAANDNYNLDSVCVITFISAWWHVACLTVKDSVVNKDLSHKDLDQDLIVKDKDKDLCRTLSLTTIL